MVFQRAVWGFHDFNKASPFLFFCLQSPATAAHWHPSAEQSNGAVVTHALPHATCFPVPP